MLPCCHCRRCDAPEAAAGVSEELKSGDSLLHACTHGLVGTSQVWYELGKPAEGYVGFLRRECSWLMASYRIAAFLHAAPKSTFNEVARRSPYRVSSIHLYLRMPGASEASKVSRVVGCIIASGEACSGWSARAVLVVYMCECAVTFR